MQKHRLTRLLVAAAFLIGTLSVADVAEATPRYGCPPIKGSSKPTAASRVVETYFELSSGCPVPLRLGNSRFGLRHIRARYQAGARNHELTPYAKRLWAEAMALPGVAKGPLYICHYKQYELSSGKKRTMRVFVDLKPYGSYPLKGIITAYWVSGHKAC